MPPDLMVLIGEIAACAAATGAVRQCEGRADMRQIDGLLLAAGRTILPGEEAALADTQNTALLISTQN